eukprot:TRINITY_DN7028_c0_g1_i1.p1 TRINITY_DN7028_c0_g1~~TRINITY_DN7028_c0_g1_i1.p1  ORF type:complete len:279 (+),score=81.67 TRINITY_DN7028_c0_g1_i1:29-865(+)
MSQLSSAGSERNIRETVSTPPTVGASPSTQSLSIEDLVLRRQEEVELLKKHHSAPMYWAGAVLLSRVDINLGVPPSAVVQQQLSRRAEQLFTLGQGFSAMLSQDNGPDAVRAAAQLLEEFEYYISSSTVQSMKAIRAKNVEDRSSVRKPNDPIRSTLYRSGKTITFEFLDTMHVPFSLDYALVVCALLDIMKLVYNKFLEQECQVEPVADAVYKIDEKIREVVFKPIASDLKKKSQTLVDMEIDSLTQDYAVMNTLTHKRRSRMHGENLGELIGDEKS